MSNLETKENFALRDLSSQEKQSIAVVLSKIENFDFNIFELNKLAGKRSIYFVLNQIYSKYGFFKLVEEDKFLNFCEEIMNGYNRDVIYHNDLHGTDVCQTTFIQLDKGNLITVIIN